MNKQVKRFNKLLTTSKTALLIIDIQERILPVINDYNSVVKNTIKLIQGFKVLGIPIFYTEQYPKGLGPTVKSIKDELQEAEAIQKLSFSCSGAGDFFETLKNKQLSQICICGIEAHVCVQQTVLDLLENGFQVNVAADATSSRKVKDYEIALTRMRHYGAEVTTVEAMLFELMNVCGTNIFKQISKIVK